jgi:hypothetical protein
VVHIKRALSRARPSWRWASSDVTRRPRWAVGQFFDVEITKADAHDLWGDA